MPHASGLKPRRLIDIILRRRFYCLRGACFDILANGQRAVFLVGRLLTCWRLGKARRWRGQLAAAAVTAAVALLA